jgi:uncharacterized repeat protein (TIGR01451 family)
MYTLWKQREQQPKTPRWRAFAAVICTLLGLGGAGLAWAVHDVGLFQLDYTTSPQQGAANVSPTNISPPGNTGDDWANVYCKLNPLESNCAGIAGDKAFARAFISDPTGAAETSFFTGGGSKDERPISTGQQHWQWDDTNDVIPDKDDIAHAFAAAYANQANGHVHFYFGADRFATDGDSQIGFWFFRQRVTLGVKPDFNGEHQVGDILVLANWGGSNKVGDIAVYKWVGGSNPLQLLLDSTQADCSSTLANDAVCAVVNNVGGETPPWPYTDKDGGHTYQPTALFEGGIDLTALLGGDIGCFSSFMAETRSSHSTTAELKDFALGEFPVCGMKVTKTGNDLAKSGDVVTYTIKIENTGLKTLYKKSISDSLLGDITNAGTNTCGASLAAGASCTVTVQRTVLAGDTDPLTNKATAVYTENSDFTGVSLTDFSSHDTNLFQPSITFAKSASQTTILQGGTVNYNLTLKNTSSSDTPDLVCGVEDKNLGVSKSVTLTPGSSDLTPIQVVFSDPSSLPWCTKLANGNYSCPNTATVTCTPKGFTNKINSDGKATVTVIPRNVALTVTKTAKVYSKVGDSVTYTIGAKNLTALPLTVTSISDSLLGALATSNCPSLAPSGSCSFTVTRTVLAADPDPLLNKVTFNVSDGGTGTASADANWTVDLVHPAFTVTKDCVSQPVPAGASANFRIRLTNGGDVPLALDITDTNIPSLNQTGVNLGVVTNPGCVDSNGNSLYDGGAGDGCYQLEGSIIATGTQVTNNVSVTATLAAYGLPNSITKTAGATCTVQQGGATRTPGFWKTHGDYMCHVLLGHDPTGASLGWKDVATCRQAEGIFWASMAKNTDGSKRGQVCQATQQADFQLLSAILNSKLSNGKSVPIDPQSGLSIIAAEQKALSACYDAEPASGTVCDRTNILRLKTLLDAYNNSGDATAIIDNDGTLVQRADPKAARATADEAFADCGLK